MPTDELAPGTVLQGTYTVIGRIGKGATGEVYEVSHARLAGRYALKLLARASAEDPETVERFAREAKIASGLRHPHIVQVIDFDRTADGRPYLVMELLDGEDLEALLRRTGPVPLPRVAVMVNQIASALSEAHGRGVVHRDLKPENLLLVRVAGQGADFVKLVDFGISKATSDGLRLTRDRVAMGTPYYMAPEQIRESAEVDARADQFALAAITYELLCGEVAFDGSDIAAVAYQVAHGEPPRLAEPGGLASPAVEAALRRALAKSATARFPAVSDFAKAFEDAAASGQDAAPAARAGQAGAAGVATMKATGSVLLPVASWRRKFALAAVGLSAMAGLTIWIVMSRNRPSLSPTGAGVTAPTAAAASGGGTREPAAAPGGTDAAPSANEPPSTLPVATPAQIKAATRKPDRPTPSGARPRALRGASPERLYNEL